MTRDELRRLMAEAKAQLFLATCPCHIKCDCPACGLRTAAANALPGLLNESAVLREQVAKEFYDGGVIAAERNAAEAEREELKAEVQRMKGIASRSLIERGNLRADTKLLRERVSALAVELDAAQLRSRAFMAAGESLTAERDRLILKLDQACEQFDPGEERAQTAMHQKRASAALDESVRLRADLDAVRLERDGLKEIVLTCARHGDHDYSNEEPLCLRCGNTPCD